MAGPADLNAISGIRLNLWSHLDAPDDGGGKVQTWGDQHSEGNDLSQATEGIRPVIVADALNGYQGLQFVSSTGIMIDRASLVSGARSATSWVCLYLKMADNAGGDEFLTSAVGSARFALFYNADTPKELEAFNGSLLATGGTAHDPLDWHLIVIQFRGSTSRIYVDGVQLVEGNAGSNSHDGFRLGARFDGNNPADFTILHASAGDGDIIGTADFDTLHEVPDFYTASPDADAAITETSPARTESASAGVEGAGSVSEQSPARTDSAAASVEVVAAATETRAASTDSVTAGAVASAATTETSPARTETASAAVAVGASVAETSPSRTEAATGTLDTDVAGAIAESSPVRTDQMAAKVLLFGSIVETSPVREDAASGGGVHVPKAAPVATVTMRAVASAAVVSRAVAVSSMTQRPVATAKVTEK
jgi:hypothetical protein